MRIAQRHVARHLLAAFLLLLAAIGGVLPILQGWMFLLLAVLVLAIEYRWVRNVFLRPLYRRYPHTYRQASHWRRRTRIRIARWCRGKKKEATIHRHTPLPGRSGDSGPQRP